MAQLHLHLDEASGVPYYRQVMDQLAERIRVGALAPGDALPSIRELAAATLVSVITIKKAYEELEDLGLVVSRQGRGTFVAPAADQAARARARTEVLAQIETAVRRGLQAGLGEAEVRAAVEAALRPRFKA